MGRHHPLSLTPDLLRLRRDIQQIVRAAIGAVDPESLVRSALAAGAAALVPGERVSLVAAGKAAWPMTRAFLDHRPAIAAGLVSGPRQVTAAARPVLPPNIEVYAGAHPWPVAASELAGRRALEIAAASRTGGALVLLISGGASSMLAVPAAGLTLADKREATRALMEAGTPVGQLNCVRKHLSAIKGGRLAALAGRTVTLAISDVHAPVEDDPAVIGSGPTAADPSTFGDALDVVRRAGVRVPASVFEHLSCGAAGNIAETPKPGDPSLEGSVYTVIGGRRQAMAGARARALEMGYVVHVIEKPTSGEARDAARTFLEAAARATAGAAGRMCAIASGETTVHVRGKGRGGRNQEFALAAVPMLSWARPAVLASVGTDGIDGPTDAAGALADSSSARRATAAGLDWQDALLRNASHEFFAPLGDLLTWGPTGTNVGDLQVLLIGEGGVSRP